MGLKPARRSARETAERFRQKPPAVRPLKAYAFDPTQGRTLGNYMTVNVKYEKLQPGPAGKYLAVIDYDATNKCYYRPIDLDDPAIMIGGGLDPAESDPQFHQQMVYAVASETIRRFELALGRPIRWSFAEGKREGMAASRLRVFPHGMQEANAFYSRQLRGLLFGYFPASRTNPGANLPGQTVFTCLSHDIIAHETTHALVDSQRDYFMEPTHVDAPAFHEAFADLVALFQHFSFREALLDTIQRSGGRIYRTEVPGEQRPANTGAAIQAELTKQNPLVGLAQQFGEAIGMRKALRLALGTPPNTRQLDLLFEPHERGAVLVAAVFDAFFSVFVRRTEDLWRIAGVSPRDAGENGLHPDLAARLAEAASHTADSFLNICIRALDYCPPVDIRFGEFLRALITADVEVVPDDPLQFRRALIDAFRSRGIVPDGADSYSEESLVWSTPEALDGRPLPPCKGLRFDVLSRDVAARESAIIRNRVVVHAFATENARALRLSPDYKIWAKKLHIVRRVGPTGEFRSGFIAELTQRRDVLIDPKDARGGRMSFRGGTTVVFDGRGDVRYAVYKRIGDPTTDDKNSRLKEQRDYQEQRAANLDAAAYLSGQDLAAKLRSASIDFRLVHLGP